MITLLNKILGGALAGSLILSGILGVLLVTTRADLSGAKEVIRSLEGWQDQMVSAIGLASGNPKVTKDTAQAQVQSMGQSLIELHNALQISNNAVDRLAELRRMAEETAAREAKARAAAIRTAEGLRDELTSRSTEPVAPADMEAEVRRAQDAAYEAGL